VIPQQVNLTNERFGSLVVQGPENPGKHYSWVCLCECGKSVVLTRGQLLRGNNISCGCLRHRRVVKNCQDLLGTTVGELTVVSYSFEWKYHKNMCYLMCKCSCGKTVKRRLRTLMKKKNLNCGHARKTPGNRDERFALRRYQKYVKSAKRKGFVFDLNLEEFKSFVAQNCFYCGAEPRLMRFKGENGEMLGHGVDRVDNASGYTKDNIVCACKFCNFAKKSGPVEEFTKWLDNVKTRAVDDYVRSSGG
jgi:hypothetical protein